MSKNKVFCEECRNDVTFIAENKQLQGTIKGEVYTYNGKVSYCNVCHSEVYVAEINDYNLTKLYDEYRKKKNIVSLDIVLNLPKKYNIGKRPLSLLLGWGEQTFTRYYDGDIPTKQYSDILQKIYNEPNYYKKILEKNKANLKSELAYKKSKNAVDKLLLNQWRVKTKIDMAIEYLLYQCEDITPLALQKALYYIQGFYYAFYKIFLFEEECQAWVHGPVYRDIYRRYKDYSFDPIHPREVFDETVLTDSEKMIFESVANYVCCYSGKILEKITHLEEPWLSTRGELSETQHSDRVISKESIGNYFNDVKEKYNMHNAKDIKVYIKDMFNQL